ncbi:hypothetical protein AAV94_10155 [Lampropedia cohaerens]|uniref:DUF4377 domain-containing protein n=1 Tax=Lampropedia cohaerens TaxID=1610491 RepID=A0A0U1PYE7_9BURK|nr:hypothetical protein AAV94_10155 [Lampropedia cohaerens]
MAACNAAPTSQVASAPAAQAAFAQTVGGTAAQPSMNSTDPEHLLRAYHWQLRSASGPDQAWFDTVAPALPAPVELTFDGQRLTVSGLCNHMGAGYDWDGETTLHVGMAMATKRACSDTALMQAEDAVGRQLSNATGLALTAPVGDTAPLLTLHFADGSAWQLQGRPTDATRFGSAPQRVFLEVAPDTVACTQHGQPSQCLQVRSVDFDDAGLRRAEGPWQVYPGTIEGYAHTPGEWTVLRINRYTPARVSSAQPAVVDVLDMVVSRQMAQPR